MVISSTLRTEKTYFHHQACVSLSSRNDQNLLELYLSSFGDFRSTSCSLIYSKIKLSFSKSEFRFGCLLSRAQIVYCIRGIKGHFSIPDCISCTIYQNWRWNTCALSNPLYQLRFYKVRRQLVVEIFASSDITRHEDAVQIKKELAPSLLKRVLRPSLSKTTSAIHCLVDNQTKCLGQSARYKCFCPCLHWQSRLAESPFLFTIFRPFYLLVWNHLRTV